MSLRALAWPPFFALKLAITTDLAACLCCYVAYSYQLLFTYDSLRCLKSLLYLSPASHEPFFNFGRPIPLGSIVPALPSIRDGPPQLLRS
jgi:hypothetical protein